VQNSDLWDIVHRAFVDVTTLLTSLTALIIAVKTRKKTDVNSHRITRLEGVRRKGGETAPLEGETDADEKGQ